MPTARFAGMRWTPSFLPTRLLQPQPPPSTPTIPVKGVEQPFSADVRKFILITLFFSSARFDTFSAASRLGIFHSMCVCDVQGLMRVGECRGRRLAVATRDNTHMSAHNGSELYTAFGSSVLLPGSAWLSQRVLFYFNNDSSGVSYNYIKTYTQYYCLNIYAYIHTCTHTHQPWARVQ